MVSGDAAARKGVSLVSRVANVNTSVRGLVASRDGPENPDPPPPAAPADRAATYITCRIARAYGSMDPEMSQSTTSRRCLVRTARLAIRTGSPPGPGGL